MHNNNILIFIYHIPIHSIFLECCKLSDRRPNLNAFIIILTSVFPVELPLYSNKCSPAPRYHLK